MQGGVGEQLLQLAVWVGFLILIALTWRSIRRRGKDSECVSDVPETEPYRVFTREHDLELSAADALATLRSASPDFSKGWLQVNGSLSSRWGDRTEALLYDEESRFEELASSIVVQFDNGAQRVRAKEICVALLIDQSGSMKGEPIAYAAVTAALMAKLLQRVGARSEILGFSTAGWHGGKAYQKWKYSGQPLRPGRLCALRHVIYKSAEETGLSSQSLRALVNLDLLRENVDGEAIEWACERLVNRDEPQKILIVVSDGAPVDDATLKHNGLNYLHRHLVAVLKDVERDVLVGAIGINHRIDAYYPVSETVRGAEELPEAAVKLVEKLFARVGERISGLA